MKVKYLQGVLSDETITEVSEFLSEEGVKVLYFACLGGPFGIATTLIDILNNSRDLTVVGTNYLYSAGFYIYDSITCPKRLAKGTRGMWHVGSIDVTMDTRGKVVYESERFQLNLHRKLNKTLVIALAKKLGFTKKERKKLKRGDDVYFSWKRMKKLFRQ